ncbi:MAG: ABC transporter permease [Fimbriimonas sp.]
MNLKLLFHELVTGNPMTIEIIRFRRKYLSWQGPSAQSSALLGLFLIVYAGVLLIVINARSFLPPQSIVSFMLALFVILVPAMLYGAIAGERERRSWDLLLVAPVSKAQIVMGKFLAASSGIGVVVGLMLVPIGFAAVTYARTDYPVLLMAILVCLSFSLLIAALTLFFSARVKRPFMALGAVMGSEIVGMVVLPTLLSAGGMGQDFVVRFIQTFHPFMLIEEMHRANLPSSTDMLLPLGLLGPPQIFAYLFLTLFFLGWTERTLSFADNEVGFLPKKKL